MVDHIRAKAEHILHQAQSGTVAGQSEATRELAEDRRKMTPAQYHQLLSDIRTSDHKERKACPDLPTVFVTAHDRVVAWVNPVTEHKR